MQCHVRCFSLSSLLAQDVAGAPSKPRMRVWEATNYSASPFTAGVHLSQLPDIEPLEGQVKIRVFASSVNPIDWKVLDGALSKIFPLKFPQKLGCDLAGTVVAVGTGNVHGLKVGDSVWGDMGAGESEGAFADFAIVPAVSVGLKPQNMQFGDAGTLPLVGKTMFQAFEKAEQAVKSLKDKVVFITSGSGGTGFIGVQMAKALGASSVISVTSTPHVEFVRSMGADVVIDYHKQNWTDVLKNDSIDVVVDNYGAPGTPDQAMAVIKKGGAFVSLAHQTSQNPKAGVSQFTLICDHARYDDLDALKQLVEANKITAHIDQTIALSRLLEAFEFSKHGGVVGKVAISMVEGHDLLV